MGSLSWSPLPPLCIQLCNTPSQLSCIIFFCCCCCCFGFRRSFGTGWRSSKGEWHERSRLCECVHKRERLRKRERERVRVQEGWCTEALMDDQITGYFNTGEYFNFFVCFHFFIQHLHCSWSIPLKASSTLWNWSRKILLQKHPCKCKQKQKLCGTDCQDFI